MANNKLAEEYLNLIAEGAPSFFAFFLLSIFTYVSVLNLSDLPTLFSDAKFWFCISNTLIFIIAVDFGAFSPPPEQIKSKQSENSAVKIVRERPNKSYRETRRGNSAKTYRRSKSEKAVEKERKIAMRRSKTMTIKLHDEEEEASKEDNEFEEMTDEELNRRVEEFIERFNRRIRLQDLEYGDADGA
ncbi:uncharacterized protein LOC111010873 [Momordica charantia]|uniref:Uncharacterized protein LOC111010873 n=1 Tax=Momordica charantia TaxID=3673 RepID=A0A6J1CEX1_MOMCH|nr:uncharacterized protein LOC111010873 [Momordica charantia]